MNTRNRAPGIATTNVSRGTCIFAAAIAATFTWSRADAQTPCGPGIFPLDQQIAPPPQHTTAKSRTRVPIVDNSVQPSGQRPYVVNELGTRDPCASTSVVALRTTGEQPGFFWERTRPELPQGVLWNGNDLPVSDCVHNLVYSPIAPTHLCQPVVVLMNENGNPPPAPPVGQPELSAQYYGFRLGVNLMRPLSIGDFVSPAPTLGESSVALLPSGSRGASTGWMGLSRPTVAGAADMVTGLPLVKELVVDPLLTMDDSEEADSESQQAAAAAQLASPYLLDGSAAPMGYEEAQKEAQPAHVQVYLEREYLWGPGDRGVDELLVQFDHTAQRSPWWVVQDDGGDVVAVCDSGGSNGKGRVVQQLTYDAYGDALTSAMLQPHPVLRCGHKALFVDRLEVGVLSSSFIEHERIVPFGHVLVYNRNRVYSPQVGRFLQADPNETGMALLDAAQHSGRGMDALSIAFGMEGHYGDGMNAYAYLGSNPWNRSDPLGLSWDPFGMVDEFMAEFTGNTAALMERIGSTMQAAAYVGAMILSQLPFPVAMIAGDIGMSVLENGVSPELRAAGKLLGEVSMARLMLSVGKIALHAAITAGKYVLSHGLRGIVNFAKGAWSMAKQAWNWMTRKREIPGTCGCFAAGTVVWTMTGLVPIQQIKPGDYVVARDEHTGMVQFAEVEAIIETPAAALLDVAVRHHDGTVEVIHTTDEHPFWVEDWRVIRQQGTPSSAWRRADELVPGDAVRTLLGGAVVLSTLFTSHRQTVFNLTVKDFGTFHVGADGLLVHNCSTIRNVHLAGKTHPKTGVPFDKDGYPEFDKWMKIELRVPGGHKGREADFAWADGFYKMLYGKPRDRHLHTWHHHQDGVRLQLVDRPIHAATGHTGSNPGP
jgi:hypothetical protein